MNDPIIQGLDNIYKDVLDHGSLENGRFTISAYEFMWLDGMLRKLIKQQSLANTVLSYVSLLYGNEIKVPNYLVASGIGQSMINITYGFLPIESGEDVGDWKIVIDVKDVSEEGEIIED